MSGEHGSICEFKKLLDGDALEPPAGQIFQNQPGIFEAVGCQVVKKENISVPETCHRLDAETDGIRNASSGITAGNGPVDHGNGKGSSKPFLVPSGDADHGGIYAGDGSRICIQIAIETGWRVHLQNCRHPCAGSKHPLKTLSPNKSCSGIQRRGPEDKDRMKRPLLLLRCRR